MGDPDEQAGEERALAAVTAYGIAFEVTRHGPAKSLEEAAAARGLLPGDLIKSLVVRRGDEDFLFVLVPGDRKFSWPKLRAFLGTNRLSMPDAAVAREVTGERGTITPFGSSHAWPVIADATVAGRTVSIGGGAHGGRSDAERRRRPAGARGPGRRHQRLTGHASSLIGTRTPRSCATSSARS